MYYRKLNMYEIVPIEEAWRETGRGPIGVSWIHCNKRRRDADECAEQVGGAIF